MVDLQDLDDGDAEDQVTLPADVPAKRGMDPLLAAHMNNLMAARAAPDAAADAGAGPSQSAAEFKAAQAQASQNHLYAGLARAGGMLSNAIAKANTPLDTATYNSLDQAADSPVAKLQAAQKFKTQETANESAEAEADVESDKNDATSDQSKTFRNLIKSQFPKIAEAYGPSFDSITAADAPNIMKVADTKAAIDQRAQSAKENAETRRMMIASRATAAEKNADTKMSKQDEDTQAKIGKELNDLTASGRNALGLASKAKIASQRLADIVSDPGATNQDLQSAYADLNQIVSGTATVSGSAHQAYSTAANQLAEIKQYITGNPSAPVIPAIKAHVLDVAQRMSKISDSVIDQNAHSVKMARSGWISRHPDEWAGMVAKQGDEVSSSSAAPMAPSSAQPAAANKPDVVQNGHTYKWNPQSRKYE